MRPDDVTLIPGFTDEVLEEFCGKLQGKDQRPPKVPKIVWEILDDQIKGFETWNQLCINGQRLVSKWQEKNGRRMEEARRQKTDRRTQAGRRIDM